MNQEIHKGLKVRIYPNKIQQIQINKTLGCSRFIYNQMLAEHINVYNELKEDKDSLYKYKYKTEKKYKEEFEWLKDVDSTALQQSRMNLNIAYKNFFKDLKKNKKVGFPKFKKKKSIQKYKTVMGIKIDYENSKIKCPKVGWINFKHKKVKEWYKKGKLKSITIIKSSTNKYYATMLVKGEQDFKGYQEFNSDIKVIGLDMSMSNFYVDNLGNSPEYKRLYRVNENILAKKQKQLSRKTRGSKNREKAKIEVAKIHEKIKNQRLDFTHKLSYTLIQNNDVIVVENLSLKGMSRGLKLGKSVHDLGYAEFVRQLQYKALWNDKTVIKADKWFASSKLCSNCGYKNKDLALKDREWVCHECGMKLNRDQNAGVNLQHYGLDFLGLGQPEVKLVETNNESA